MKNSFSHDHSPALERTSAHHGENIETRPRNTPETFSNVTLTLNKPGKPNHQALNIIFASVLSLMSPNGIAATLTCVSDAFTGANNSAPDPANWTVQKVSGSFTPSIVSNRLRLTDTSGNSSTRVTNKNLFPFGNNIVVAEFDYWAYGGTGADGIAVIFSDPDKPTSGANNPPTPGGFGGSLGYANRDGTGCNVAGFTYGWLGIGIDEYGNYANPTECRNGGPGVADNAISVRGSGNGATSPSTSNYAYITGTGALGTRGVARENSSTAYRYRITLDSLTNLSKIMVKVEQDKNTGSGYQTLINYDIMPKITAGTQATLPSRLQFTYTGSTGGSTNNHEVDNVQICAASIVSGSAPHHMEIQSSTANGITCMSTVLTIKACADAACSTPHTGGVSWVLSATGTPTTNITGGGAYSIPAGSSTTTKTIQVTTPGSVVFDATGGSSATTCNFGSPSCTFTAADSGLLVTAPNHIAETSQTLTIQAVKKSDNSLACTPAITGSKTLNLKHAYVNPTTGTQTARVGGTALSTGWVNIPVTFDASGTATPTLQYADAGSVRIDATYTGTAGSSDAGLTMTGSGSFITRPNAFTFGSFGSGLNKSGVPFSAAVFATNALGTVTPNFGKETTPEGVTLSSLLSSPAGGANPTLVNRTIPGTTFITGTATVNNLRWDEVGTIALRADITSGAYLGTANATGTSSNLGRFIPDHFDTTINPPMNCVGMICPGNGMAYSGQPFTTNVTAKNGVNATTTNYDGALGGSKQVTLSATSALGGSISTLWSMSNNTIPASSFTSGSSVVATTPKPTFNFNVTPTVPTDIYVRATDTDGATSLRSPSNTSVEGGIKVVSGKLKLSNAYGSELLNLSIPIEAQYYNTSGAWTRNISDSTSVLNTTTNLVQTIITGPLTSVTAAGFGPLSIAAGSTTMTLIKPGVAGNVDLSFSAPSYLPSNIGRATFWVYKSPLIYRRENY